MAVVDEDYKEVYFHMFCKKCKHWVENDEQKQPCFECLEEPVNLHSHRPVRFESKED